MIGIEIFSKIVQHNNVKYKIYTRCDGECISVLLEPIPFPHKKPYNLIRERYVTNDGEIDWHKTDLNDRVLMLFKKDMEELVNQTLELMEKSKKLIGMI